MHRTIGSFSEEVCIVKCALSISNLFNYLLTQYIYLILLINGYLYANLSIKRFFKSAFISRISFFADTLTLCLAPTIFLTLTRR